MLTGNTTFRQMFPAYKLYLLSQLALVPLLFFCDGTIAAPRNDAAQAVMQAFVDDPAGRFQPDPRRPWQAREFSQFVDSAKQRMLGATKLVYADENVSIAAVEVVFPALTQTLYVRAQRKDGQWSILDWSSLLELQTNALMMTTISQANDEEWRKVRNSLPATVAGVDLETVKDNMRRLLGSDETLVELLAPNLNALKALCRQIAGTAEIGPMPANAESLRKLSSTNAVVARIREEALAMGIATLWREEDSGVISLVGVTADGKSSGNLERYLLCTPDVKAMSLQVRLAGTTIIGIRDLGDHVYFVRAHP